MTIQSSLLFCLFRDRLTCPAKFVIYLYILKNEAGGYYIGITSLNVTERLKRHNKGDVFSTKTWRPWTIIHVEDFQNFKDARVKEKQIKNWKGGNAFKKFISRAAGSSNGRTADSESANLGSIPSPAALEQVNKFGGVK